MLLVLMLVSQLASQPPQVLNTYECQGMTDQGKYQMRLEIEQEKENFYLIWWSNKVEAKGFGLKVGDTLSVVYITILGQLGVANYKVSAGRLEGVWAVGDGELYYENCAQGKPKLAEDER